jgi:hypothetical protein
MLRQNLLELEHVLILLGAESLCSTRSWLTERSIPIITLGAKEYCVSKYIDQVIEDQLNSFLNAKIPDSKKAKISYQNERDNTGVSNELGDWIDEEAAMKLSGLKRTALFNLRKQGKIIAVPIAGKKKFYRKSSFEKLLNENEKIELFKPL